MKIHQRNLQNGLRLRAVEMPGTDVVTTLVLVGAGSRYETKDISGISHFLEHMFFKGAKKYPSPKAVAMAVDTFGGEFNAFTGKEYAGYYVKAGKTNFSAAVDVLADMLLSSTFQKEEIEKERGVILEEMAMYLDAPMYQISWDFERLVFGDQPLGWDQIGTKELIKTVTQDQFFTYQDELYTPDNTVICVAGAVNEKSLDELEEMFQFKNKTKKRTAATFDKSLGAKKVHLRPKKTEQFHINFGVRCEGETHADFPILKVLAAVLGGNMSSRMWQTVREEKGLAYSVRVRVEDFSDTGIFTTRAGVRLQNGEEAIKAIRQEYEKVAKDGVTEAELALAKSFLCGKVDLSTEDTEDVAHNAAKQELLYKRVLTNENWKEQIQKVSQEDILRVAKDLFKPENYRFAGIGGLLSEIEIEKLIS